MSVSGAFGSVQRIDLGLGVSVLAAATTIDTTYHTVLANATTAAFTITLPTAVGNTGKRYRFKKTDATTNAVTIDANGSQTIDGALTYVLSARYQGVEIASDGVNWFVLWPPFPVGGNQYDLAEPFDSRVGITNVTIVAQTVYLTAVRVGRPITVTKLIVATGATGGNVDAAIFDTDGLTRLVASTGVVASTANVPITIPLAATFTYQPGKTYYHALLVDNAAATVRGFGGLTSLATVGTTVRALAKAVAQNTIPATISTPTGTAFNLWSAGAP